MSHETEGRATRDAVKWTDVVNVAVSISLLICAAAALMVSYWQWGEAAKQLAFARESAAASGKETREALRISRELAIASREQAKALSLSAESARKVAASTERQARLATRALSINELSKIDIRIEPQPHSTDGVVIAHYVITNNSSYPIDAEIEHVSIIANFFGLRLAWTGERPVEKLRLVPGIPRTIEDHTQNGRGFEKLWGYYSFEYVEIYHSVRVSYRDINGKKQIDKQCIMEASVTKGFFKPCLDGWDQALAKGELGTTMRNPTIPGF